MSDEDDNEQVLFQDSQQQLDLHQRIQQQQQHQKQKQKTKQMPLNANDRPYLPDADDVDLEQVQDTFPLSCSTNDNNVDPDPSQPLLSSQDSVTRASIPDAYAATNDTDLFDVLTQAINDNIPAPYANDFYAPILQEAFNESEQMDHLTSLFLVNELIDLHNRHILNASAAKPIHFTDPSLKAQSAIQMLTKICPTPGYASLLQHVLTHETISIENALDLVSLWREAHAHAIAGQSQSC